MYDRLDQMAHVCYSIDPKKNSHILFIASLYLVGEIRCKKVDLFVGNRPKKGSKNAKKGVFHYNSTKAVLKTVISFDFWIFCVSMIVLCVGNTKIWIFGPSHLEAHYTGSIKLNTDR